MTIFGIFKKAGFTKKTSRIIGNTINYDTLVIMPRLHTFYSMVAPKDIKIN